MPDFPTGRLVFLVCFPKNQFSKTEFQKYIQQNKNRLKNKPEAKKVKTLTGLSCKYALKFCTVTTSGLRIWL